MPGERPAYAVAINTRQDELSIFEKGTLLHQARDTHRGESPRADSATAIPRPFNATNRCPDPSPAGPSTATARFHWHATHRSRTVQIVGGRLRRWSRPSRRRRRLALWKRDAGSMGPLPTLKQGGGGVISVQTLNGGTFDAIVFADRSRCDGWRAATASSVHATSRSDEAAKPGELIQVAITYADDGRITIFRNGRNCMERLFRGRTAEASDLHGEGIPGRFGMRHNQRRQRVPQGEIEEARLYDFALTTSKCRRRSRPGVECIFRRTARSDERRRPQIRGSWNPRSRAQAELTLFAGRS